MTDAGRGQNDAKLGSEKMSIFVFQICAKNSQPTLP